MNREAFVKIAVLFIFILLVSVPFGVKKYEEMTGYGPVENQEEVLDRYGFYLEEVTDRIGVDFVHRRATVDKQLHHIMPQVSSMGASVSVVDYNNDGSPDFYLTNSEFGTENALYRNNGDGTFTDMAGDLGIAKMNTREQGVSMGSVWGDYNNDGREDLFLYRWGKPELYRNDGEDGFTRVTERTNLPEHLNTNAAIWLDYDNDGYLDLFIAGYYHEEVNLFNLSHTKIMPDSYEYATNGGLNYLFKNRGDGTFEDVSVKAGVQQDRRWTLAAAAADINNSGYPDIVLANDYGVDQILLNDGNGRFRNAGEEAGIGFVPKSGMSVAFGDILNRGEYSIYITNISEPGVLMQGNNLWIATQREQAEVPFFRNVAGNMGVEVGDWSYAGKFADLNNNGLLDLYVANGYISAEPGTDYWYDYAKVVGGNRSIIMDAVNWPAMEGRTFSGYQSNKIWLNDGAGRFREVASAVGGALDFDSRAVAFADLFGTGTMDLIVANQHQPVKIFRNTVHPAHHWISFNLTGTKSNRSAIGAEIILYHNGGQSRKRVEGGEAFSSQSQRDLHFGLGEEPQIEKVEIRWPSGRVQTVERPEANRRHLITEPSEE